MPEQELTPQALQALRGGLRGRFRGSLDRLENAFELLEIRLAQGDPAGQEEDWRALMEQIGGQLVYLRRLGDFVSDAALASILPEACELQPVELLRQLQELCDAYNEEALLRGIQSTATLQKAEGLEVLPTMGAPALLNGLIANLLSNSLQADPQAAITLACAPGRFTYCDSGAGLPQDACDLLLAGRWSERLLYNGGVGLLLIRTYAQTMGWQITAHAGAPLQIDFALPPCRAELGLLVFESRGPADAERRRCIARELDALQQRRRPNRDVSYL